MKLFALITTSKSSSSSPSLGTIKTKRKTSEMLPTMSLLLLLMSTTLLILYVDATMQATTTIDNDNANDNDNDKDNYVGDYNKDKNTNNNNTNNYKKNNVNMGEVVLRRGKRYLDFTAGSRMSWRTTAKNNILTVNTLWAYGYGYRANFPFADKKDRLRPFFKRDVLHALADTLDGHGFDGRACLLKSYCTATLEVDAAQKNGMLFKILKVIFSLDKHDRRHMPYLRTENCHQLLHNHCPLSFNNISPYTDDV